MKRAAFLDRDGTIVEDRGYACRFDPTLPFAQSDEAIRLLNKQGLLVIIVTNQSSIARGICSEEQVREFHEQMIAFYRERAAYIDAVYFCPFLEGSPIARYNLAHPGRKPEPGMLLQAAKEMNIDLTQSVMIGDSDRDVAAGKRAGCKTIRIVQPPGIAPGGTLPDTTASCILEAVKKISFLFPSEGPGCKISRGYGVEEDE